MNVFCQSVRSIEARCALKTKSLLHIGPQSEGLICQNINFSCIVYFFLETAIIGADEIPSLSWTWWRHQMETFSAILTLCAGNSPVTGEFPSQRPVTRSFGVFFVLRLNKRLSKQSKRRWFETPSGSSWCHCNEENLSYIFKYHASEKRSDTRRHSIDNNRIALVCWDWSGYNSRKVKTHNGRIFCEMTSSIANEMLSSISHSRYFSKSWL